MTTTETINAFMAENDLAITAEFVPFSKSRNAGNKDRSLNWRVTLQHKGRDVLKTDYSAGIAHCPGYKQRMTGDVHHVVEYETENGRRGWWSDGFNRAMARGDRTPIAPDAASVLHSLILDADVLDHPTYEDWAADFGYDPDSRKGEAIYRACLEIALKLRAGLGEALLAKAREAVQDY